jgi:tyrosyl-tRNA synthetase
MDILEELRWRGLLYQCTDEAGLAKRLAEGPVTLYCGYDPSADSLQVGNLLSITLLKRFEKVGHRPIALVGGATGLIGDPKMSGERVLQPADKVAEWSQRFKLQLGRFLDFGGPSRLVNNYDWLEGLGLIGFLRDVGKHFPLTQMVARETVKARLESGISYTEFSYAILQAYDFKQLHDRLRCELQVGGSDQWGNITAGCELVRRTGGKEVFGLTTPLVTDQAGKKLGKTETGTVWLDPAKTSPYEFYQFWLNMADADAGRLLRFFTFLDRAEIEALEVETKDHPERRAAQRRLAHEVTAFVHGEEALKRALRITEAFFQGGLEGLTRQELEEAPSQALPRSPAPTLVEALVACGLSSSKTQARQDLAAKSVHLHGKGLMEDPAFVLDPVSLETTLHGRYSVLRKGKKNYRLIRWLD